MFPEQSAMLCLRVSGEELTGQDELSAWVKTKAADAAETWQVMMQSTDEVAVGGHVIAGKTADMMGVLDGQRYK